MPLQLEHPLDCYAFLMLREPLEQWAHAPCDLLVIGGGATGLGVAVQAALEGRRVALVEARDFASGTSSRSTKLLHGGVRYLAQGRLKLVWQALRERATVLQLAPHLAQPLSFVVAETSWLTWGVTAFGLKLYAWMAGGLSLGRTQMVSARAMQHVLPTLVRRWPGVRYWDGQFDDARLAVTLANTAAQAGGRVRNHTRVSALTQTADGWCAELHDEITGQTARIQAACVVNAAGVWVDRLRTLALGEGVAPDRAVQPLVQPSQGVHLVVDRATLPLTEAVLVPRTSDGRVLFAVPWLGATVIGTTDTPRQDAPLEPEPTAQELAFLLQETRRCLGLDLQPEQIRSVWVGLRPLVSPAGPGAGRTSALSREHLIAREAPGFWTVTGGKWTTYRSMAAEVLQGLVGQGDLPSPAHRVDTRTHRLWGAPESNTLMPTPDLKGPPGPHLLGSQAGWLSALPGQHAHLGLGLTEAMVRYCARHEWAITVEDMLARRWRVLFLDSRLAQAMARRVAEILQQETGLDPELTAFLGLCQRYRLPSESPPAWASA